MSITPLLILFALLSPSICTSPNLALSFHQPNTRLLDTNPSQKSIRTTFTNTQNYGYFLTMKVGHQIKDQYYTMLLDVGTPWTWIPNQDCENCVFSDISSLYYDCSANPETCKQNISRPVPLQYANGSVLTYPGHEIISFEGLPLNASINCSIYFAQRISSDFYEKNANGIIGLGLDSTGSSNILTSLHSHKLIENKMFSLYITDDYFQNDQLSTVIFGSYDPQYMKENSTFTYAANKPQDGWAIEIDNFQVGNISIPINTTNAIISSHFPDIGVPPGFIDDFLSALGQMGIECLKTGEFKNPVCKGYVDDISKFPTIKISGGGINLEIPPAGYTYFLIDNTFENSSISDDYKLMLVFRTITKFNLKYKGKWILGADFLRNFYTVFDQDNQRIGFAPVNNELFGWNKTYTSIYIMVGMVAVFLVVACFVLGRELRKQIQGREDGTESVSSHSSNGHSYRSMAL